MSTRSEWRISKTEAVGDGGMVTADHFRAAEAGAGILAQGGDAVDAAVATAFAMGVVSPGLSGIGGVAAIVAHRADRDETVVIDGGGLAPAATREDMFELVEGGTAGMYGWPATRDNEQNEGYRSLGVMGMVACLLRAHERFGRLPLARVMAPAIALAADGFTVDWHLGSATAAYSERLWKSAEAKRVFFRPSGAPLRPALGIEPADRLAQPDLARTLERIAADGAEAFYEGDIARAIVADVAAHGGLLTLDDLAAYRAREMAPLVSTYRHREVRTLPGPGGGITAIETLNILERFPLGELEPGGAGHLHLVAEASRRAFHDRFSFLGDPEATADAYARLASKEHAAGQAARISPDRAEPELAAPQPAATAEHTTHLCAADAHGNVVSLTATLGQGYGSGIVARGTGIVLADVMTWFDPRPGRPNSAGPRKRILWAVAPAIVFAGGRPWLAVGAPGGRKIVSAVPQCIVHAVDHGDGPQVAVSRPRVHREAAETIVDARVPERTRARLAAMGHRVVVREDDFLASWFARPNAIMLGADGVLRGGVNEGSPALAIGLDRSEVRS